MKYIALIMAMFILSDATSACGITELCCGDQSELVEQDSKSCCKDDSKSDSDTSSESACCQHAVLQMPVLTIAMPSVETVEISTSLKVSPVIFNHSTDFNDDIWQPPKFS